VTVKLIGKIKSIWRRIVAGLPRYDIETNRFQISESQSLEPPVTKSTVSANQNGTAAVKPDVSPLPKICE
jgi:hypothetical protein